MSQPTGQQEVKAHGRRPGRQTRSAGAIQTREAQRPRQGPSLIPLLTEHHLEKLLGGKDDRSARAHGLELASSGALWMIARHGCAHEEHELGKMRQRRWRRAQACAALIAIRARTRDLLLRTGSGSAAIGEDERVLDVVRPMLRARQPGKDVMAGAVCRCGPSRRRPSTTSMKTTVDPADFCQQLPGCLESWFDIATRNGEAAKLPYLFPDEKMPAWQKFLKSKCNLWPPVADDDDEEASKATK